MEASPTWGRMVTTSTDVRDSGDARHGVSFSGGRTHRTRSDIARAGFAIRDQAVEVLADVGRLGGGAGEGDRLLEGGARLGRAAELEEQGAAQAEEVEVAVELGGERLDQRERLGGAAHLGEGDRAV